MHYPYLRFHVHKTFFCMCVSLCIQISPFIGHQPYWIRTHNNDLILTWFLTLWRHYLQISTHSGVLVVRTLTCLFGVLCLNPGWYTCIYLLVTFPQTAYQKPWVLQEVLHVSRNIGLSSDPEMFTSGCQHNTVVQTTQGQCFGLTRNYYY